ncbi:hypothetical protein EMIT0158MI4_140033 [Burkholderia ambifaria]
MSAQLNKGSRFSLYALFRLAHATISDLLETQ